MPDYAKDLKLNLGSIARSTELSEQQLWGALVATAAATRSEKLLREISGDAVDILSAEAHQAALGAASIMGMNNVLYHTKGQLDGCYDDLRAGLRINIIANPGVPKADLELWSLAVSAINGCGHACRRMNRCCGTRMCRARRFSRRSGWRRSSPASPRRC